MGFSGTVSIWAMKDNDYQATNYPGTTAGLQAAIDSLAGGKGIVQVGPGELLTDTAIWIHSGTHLRGSGRAKTVIKRATGSITDADAANSGAVIASSVYGSNGTLSASGSEVSNIEISDLTVDGNYSAFGALASGTPHQAGLLIKSCDGLLIHGVTAQNTLRSGFMLMECKNVVCTGVRGDTNGQFSISTTKNAFDFYNFSVGTAGYGVNFTLSDFEVYNCGDEAISLTAVSDVVIENGIVDGCDFVLEIQANNVPTPVSRISMTNVVAKNVLSWFIPFFYPATFTDITISNCDFSGHATLHDAGAIYGGLATTGNINDMLVSNCTFRNINTADTTTRNWVELDQAGGATHSNIKISDCNFYGKPSATATNYGIVVQGQVRNIVFDNVLVKDCKTNGFVVLGFSSGTTTAEGIYFRNCRAENVGNNGWFVGANFTTATITDVRLEGCEVRDAGLVTATSTAFLLQNNAAGSTSRVYVTGCRARIGAATHLDKGVLIVANGGTYDQIYIADCDLSDIATPLQVNAGVTNVRFQARPGRGTDIASGATIAIPSNGDVFHVTGSTNVTNGITVNAWDNGRTVKLIFDSTPTVSDTGTSVLNGDFVATANDVLTLTCDGTNWYEVARSTN